MGAQQFSLAAVGYRLRRFSRKQPEAASTQDGHASRRRFLCGLAVYRSGHPGQHRL